MKECLSRGFPFVFGFQVFESFESQEVASSGIMPMPQANEKIVGGHAVLAVGFDEKKQIFIIRNSWGNKWGNKGYFTMPYEFINNTDYCFDFWVVQRVKDQ